MTPAEAIQASGRSESWLNRHTCAWCNQTLWRALRIGCGAIYEPCDPTKKDFSPIGNLHDPRGVISEAKANIEMPGRRPRNPPSNSEEK